MNMNLQLQEKSQNCGIKICNYTSYVLFWGGNIFEFSREKNNRKI